MALETFSALDRDSRTRHDTDTHLSWGAYILLGIVTFGIYTIYINYKLIDRQQEHFKRMRRFADDLIRLVEEQIEVSGGSGSLEAGIEGQLLELRGLNDDFQRFQRGKERSAALWTILSVVTLGLAFFYVLYFLNADLVRHQRIEADFVEKGSALLTKLGIGKYPIQVEQVVPDRSYPLYLFLTIITIGIFELYWSYVRIKDPNEHFKEHDRFEDQFISTIRMAA
jgi:hypothetical protein